MKFKSKYKYGILTSLSFGIVELSNACISLALTITPYTLEGSNQELTPNSSPPAYIISGSLFRSNEYYSEVIVTKETKAYKI